MRRLLLIVLLLALTLITHAQDTPELAYAYTYHQPTGNRFVAGQGTFPNVRTVDIPLEGTAAWVLMFPPKKSAFDVGFLIIMDNGQDQYLELQEIGYQITPSGPLPSFDYPMPPVSRQGGVVGIDIWLPFKRELLSPYTHIIRMNDDFIYIEANTRDLVFWLEHEEVSRLPLNVLPDARIVVNAAGQIAVYTGANDQIYRHGVLGDPIEATSVSVLEVVDDQLQVITTITLPETDVFEGISPLWADIDEDGVDDLVVTVSNAQAGAQVHAYRVDGSLLATGPAIGRGGRWRHQLAFGPFGPNGENELVDVLTPHIGGVVEFYRLNGDQLEIVATLPGYTSHIIGSRNLDMAVAGDFNGDGQPEIVLPTQDRLNIAGLQHSADGVTEVWRLPLAAQLSSNLSAVTLPDNTLALAAGTVAGTLHIWLPGS